MIYYWLLIKLTRVPGATGAGQFLVQNTWIRCTSLVASASATSVAGASTSASASGPSRDSASASTSTSTASPASVLEQVLDFFQLVGVLLDGRLQGMLGAALGACITGPHLEDSLQKVMKPRNKIFNNFTSFMPFSAATSDTNETTSLNTKGGSPIAPLLACAAKSLVNASLRTRTCSLEELEAL